MLTLLSKDKVLGNKKIIENLVLFLILFIIVIVVINGFGKQKSDSMHSQNITGPIIETVSKNSEDTLEDRKCQFITCQIDMRKIK